MYWAVSRAQINRSTEVIRTELRDNESSL
ncbi:uncharacterized protein METZ01_LOCUS16954 [marine metagenome]|uniref:Uncharacterized protein n=1 Tax=marine metagenome TaxID=408172 RepID=A0A381PAW7_9ZZZZ